MTRILFAFCVAQLAAVAYLGFQIAGHERRHVQAAAPVAQAAATEASDWRTSAALAAVPKASEIRKIVREELAAVRAEIVRAEGATPGSTPKIADHSPGAIALDHAVRQEIDGFIARGRISEFDMAEFNETLAGLPPEQRRAALQALAQAINSGKVKGRF